MIQIFVFYKLKSDLRTVLSVSGGATLLKYHINASNPSKFPQLKNGKPKKMLSVLIHKSELCI